MWKSCFPGGPPARGGREGWPGTSGGRLGGAGTKECRVGDAWRKRRARLIAAAAIVLPVPALAAEDCAARIEAIEAHPAFSEAGTAEAPAGNDGASPSSTGESNEEKVAEQAENGEAVQEDGGTTVYQEGGPAGPRENWFGSPPDKAKVLEHVEAAKQARDAGDEQACLQETQQAEKIMGEETREEREREQQSD